MDFSKIKLTDSTVISAELKVISEDGEPSVEAYCINVESCAEEGSFIRHIFWLPLEWNGIFLGIGNGGAGGKLGTSLYVDARDGTAVGQTDMGTYRMVNGEKTQSYKSMMRDYGWRSTHLMTVVGKELILAFYGRLPDYCYFNGASAGGKQALSEAQRYPEDYDGIIARCPSFNSVFLGMHFLWMYRCLRNRDGTTRIKDTLRDKITASAVKFFECDGSLGARYGFVSTGYVDENTVNDFLEFLRQEISDITDEQLEILRKIYEGPKNSETGEQIHCGLPIGAEKNCGYFDEIENIPEYDSPWFKLFFGQDFDERTFDYADQVDEYFYGNAEDFGAVDPNLSAFYEHGGKLIMTSGGSDPYGPWADAMNYYNRVLEFFGDKDKVMSFFRYFVIPGKGHSTDGLGATDEFGSETMESELSAIRKWREQCQAPECIYGARLETKENSEGRTYKELVYIAPVYPYMGDKKEGINYPKCTSARYIDEQVAIIRESIDRENGFLK